MIGSTMRRSYSTMKVFHAEWSCRFEGGGIELHRTELQDAEAASRRKDTDVPLLEIDRFDDPEPEEMIVVVVKADQRTVEIDCAAVRNDACVEREGHFVEVALHTGENDERIAVRYFCVCDAGA